MFTCTDAGGQTIFSGTITAENNASKTPVWETATTTFTPTTSGDLLVRFEGQGTDNTFGMLLDNTVLVKADVDPSMVDLDIDSINDNRLLAPDRSPLEDDIEVDHAKKVVINDNDTDGDGIPDYADGFGYGDLPETQQGIAGKGFTPIVLQIPENLPLSYMRMTFSYAGSDPMNVGAGFALPDDGGMIRLWTENASAFRSPDAVTAGGNYIPSDVVIEDVTALGFTETERTRVFYIEGVQLPERDDDAGEESPDRYFVPISVMVTTADDAPVGGDLVNVAVVANTIVIGIDGTSQQDWLTGPNARRPGDANRWNSHVRNLIEDVSSFAMVQYDFGSVEVVTGKDSPAIATRMIERAEDTIKDAGGGTKIAVVGWSRGGMIAIQVANVLSLNAGGGLPRDVVFAGLYDPVAESNYIDATWRVVDAGVGRVTIVGPTDPRREPAANVVNVDYRIKYRNLINDKDFRREAYFDEDPTGLFTIPRIRHAGGEALMTRPIYNASHGGIGGTPGYNERHLEPADGGKYDYALDVESSFQSDKAVRDGMRAAGLNFVPDRPDAWYGFAATRPI